MRINQKRLVCLLLVFVLAAALLPAGAQARSTISAPVLRAAGKPGTVAGTYYSTDIVTTVNGAPIQSINIGGRTLVSAEDLMYHGYQVVWNGSERTLRITWKDAALGGGPAVTTSGLKSGTPLGNYYYTDIVTYLNGTAIDAWNTGGRTYICAEDMAAYGCKVVWDGSARTLTVTTNGATAPAAQSTPPETPETPVTPEAPAEPASGSRRTQEELTAYLRSKIWAGEEEIRLSIQKDIPQGAEVKDAMTASWNALTRMPDMFALKSWEYRWSGDDLQLYPTYDAASAEDYAEMRRQYSARLSELVSLFDKSWSDLEKVLYLNTYLALHFSYVSGKDNDPAGYKDALRFMTYGTGNCQAYTKTAMAVLEQLGIPASWCFSDSLDHVWNLVQLGGRWYHADFTWGDPTPDTLGYGSTYWMLLSTDTLRTARDGKHWAKNDWVYGKDVTCTDTSYENAFWREAVSPLIRYGKLWYAVLANGLVRWDPASGARWEVEFPQLYADWYPNWTFTGYAGMSGLFVYEGRLIFNTAFHIFRYDPVSGDLDVLLDLLESDDRLNCCDYYKDNMLVLQTRDGSYYSLTID